MARSTPATLALTRLGLAFEVLAYDYDPAAPRIGLQAAQALGEAPQRVLKTLVAQVDGKPVCLVVPSDREVSMKKVAAAFGGKAAQMMPPADAERITGYKVGGVSPFGQKRPAPTVVDAEAAALPAAFVNAGQRGLQARLAPADMVRALGAIVAVVT